MVNLYLNAVYKCKRAFTIAITSGMLRCDMSFLKETEMGSRGLSYFIVQFTVALSQIKM